MARPVAPRAVHGCCKVKGFRPWASVGASRTPVVLGLDEWEALRLSDGEGLYQQEAAARMDVSRTTYSRILSRARNIVVKALIEGYPLVIGPATVIMREKEELPCPVHGGAKRRGRRCRCGDSGISGGTVPSSANSG